MKPEIAAKQVRKLLRNPAGRRALGLVDEKRGEPRIRVAILVPSYKQPHPLMQETVGEMVAYSRQFVDVYIPPRTSSSVIHWSRNSMVSQLELAGESYDYILFVDDDMVVKPDFLMKLLSHKVDIIGGICTRRTDPPMPTIRFLDKNMRYGVIVKWDQSKPLLEIDAVGTGFMLISRNALEAVGEYFLRCGYERQTFGSMFNKCEAGAEAVEKFEQELAVVEAGRRDFFRKTGNTQWFQFLASLVQEGEYGEDISFCMKAKLAGLKIHVDTSVTPGHIGDYVYSVDDFFAYQDQAIAQAEG